VGTAIKIELSPPRWRKTTLQLEVGPQSNGQTQIERRVERARLPIDVEER